MESSARRSSQVEVDDVQQTLSQIDEHLEKLRSSDFSLINTTIEQHLNSAEGLLYVNLPKAREVYEILLKSIDTKDKLLVLRCRHGLVQASLGTLPLSDSLAVAKEGFEYAQCILPNQPQTNEELNAAYLESSFDLATVYRIVGQLDEADRILREALQFAKDHNCRDGAHRAKVLQGIVLLSRGELGVAIRGVFTPLMEESLSDENKGLLLQALGNACRSAAQWGPAKDHMREAISIAKKMGDKAREAERHCDLGTIYRSEGRIADALEHQRKLYDFALERGDMQGLCSACFGIGFSHYSTKPRPDYKQALLHLGLQKRLADRLQDVAMRGIALNCLGKTFTDLGKYEDAIQAFEERVEIAQQTGNIAGEGMAYGNLGTAHRCIGNYEEALKYHHKYLMNAERRDDTGGAAIMLRELALDYLFMDDSANAEVFARKALTTLDTIRAQLGPEDTSKIANYEKNQADAYNLLIYVLVKAGRYKDALVVSEIGRARALTDLMILKAGKSYAPPQSLNETDIYDLARRFQTSFVVYSIVNEIDPRGKRTGWFYIWLVTIEEGVQAPRVYFGKHLNVSDPDLVDESNETIALDEGYFHSLCRSMQTMDDLDRTQNSDSESDSDSEEDETERDPGKMESAQEQPGTTRFKTWVASETPVRMKTEGQLRALYDTCIAPIAKHLPVADVGDESHLRPRLTIIPQDFLFKVPFAALQAPDHSYMVQKFVMNCSPSILAFKLSQERREHLKTLTRKTSMIAIGNPLTPFTGKQLPQLLGAEKEVKRVRKCFKDDDVSLLLGENARKDKTMAEVKAHSVIHIAAHAAPHEGVVDLKEEETEFKTADGDYSTRGCLFMAPSNPDCQGILLASEIMTMDIPALLVVLSCCETGLGKITADGVLGLYRAFLVAGTASVLVSLWKIKDKATCKFMTFFYKQYKKHGDISLALHEAMLKMLQHRKYHKPHHWAAFALMGAS
ncbi:tetratricopeptide repeat protein 28 isoform X2 [Lingula anatina]|uniref:Tetratricopeptide repeat protein 28 isoform X2 n=1 Tax=Lingula anatina TaxID=7574 RepID=A0A1S3ISN0_LINAN|nr:tetratricopeptide repeat protein 28 isoform X2 [Lingula anatina]|eukprot:XP_013401212.1 tetratricopeptide repeat protein 28 isoform X2 [Lingula anatina]